MLYVRMIIFRRRTDSPIRNQITFFMGDFQNATTSANSFDSKVNSDASKISSDYASIVELSIRQVLGATEITVSKNADGTFNTSDVLMFMKGSSVTQSRLFPVSNRYNQKYPVTGCVIPTCSSIFVQRHYFQNVNTVDVVMPSWPAFLYTNPKLGRFLLEGLFRYQATGQYPNKWSVHDLGADLSSLL